MTNRPIILRDVALQDVDAAIQYYAREAGEAVTVRFIDALGTAYSRIATRPGIGSPRYDLTLGLPGLRSLPVKRFPYLIFYLDRGDHIDLWRVLHTHRDIPAWLAADA